MEQKELLVKVVWSNYGSCSSSLNITLWFFHPPTQMQDKDYLQQSEEVGFIMSNWWPPPTLNFPYSISESLYLIASSNLDALLFLSFLLSFRYAIVLKRSVCPRMGHLLVHHWKHSRFVLCKAYYLPPGHHSPWRWSLFFAYSKYPSTLDLFHIQLFMSGWIL